MALLSPLPLTQVWNVAHGLSRWFSDSLGQNDFQVGSNALVRAGRYEQAGPDDLGCTLIVFDPDTGEPQGFASHLMVNASGVAFLKAFHFPADNAIVLVGVLNPSTATDHRVYAQRVEYDVGTVSLTGGPVAEWAPNPPATGSVSAYAPGCTSSSTVHVLAWGVTVVRLNTLDLSSGGAGTATHHTPGDLFGGGRDRIELGGGWGAHGPGVVALSSYVNASGAASAETFVLPFSDVAGSVVDTGLGRTTAASGARVAVDGTSTLISDYTIGGITQDRLLDAGGLSVAPSAEVRYGDPTIWASETHSTHDDGLAVAFNREGPAFGGFNDLRARRYDVSTGVESGAWEYPGNFTDYGLVGLFSANERFWFADFSTHIRVYEDLAWSPPAWFTGHMGWTA